MSEPREHLTVYVVDAEEVIASSLAIILQCHGGFYARAFTKSCDALRAAQMETPDLFIIDVVTPQLAGIDLAIQVRESWPKCKILLFSGQACTAPLLETAIEKGYDFHLVPKPIPPADLLATIRNLTGQMADARNANLNATALSNRSASYMA